MEIEAFIVEYEAALKKKLSQWKKDHPNAVIHYESIRQSIAVSGANTKILYTFWYTA